MPRAIVESTPEEEESDYEEDTRKAGPSSARGPSARGKVEESEGDEDGMDVDEDEGGEGDVEEEEGEEEVDEEGGEEEPVDIDGEDNEVSPLPPRPHTLLELCARARMCRSHMFIPQTRTAQERVGGYQRRRGPQKALRLH